MGFLFYLVMARLIRKAHCTCKTDCQAPNSCFLLRKDVIVSHQYNKYKEKYEEKMQVERMKAWRKSSFCWLFHSNLLLLTRSKNSCNHTDISRPTSYRSPVAFPPPPQNAKEITNSSSWNSHGKLYSSMMQDILCWCFIKKKYIQKFQNQEVSGEVFFV